MPLYDYRCSECGHETEILQTKWGTEVVICNCGTPMERRFTAPAMIKIKGEGGYPSRRKQIFNTTKRNHPPLEHETNKVYF